MTRFRMVIGLRARNWGGGGGGGDIRFNSVTTDGQDRSESGVLGPGGWG